MTSKERVRRAIRFEKPDIIPVDYWILPGVYLKYSDGLYNLLEKFPKDFPDALDVDRDNLLPPSHRKGEYTDCFGSVWRQEYDGFLGQVVKHPLEDIEKIKAYSFPDPQSGEISVKQIKNIVERVRADEKFISVDSIRTFERMHFLRGMEDVMIDLAYQKDEFFFLLDKVVDWNIAHMQAVLDELKNDVDGIWFSDDWGSQNSLLIRPETWRTVFKTRYKKMFDTVKRYGKPVLFHSDGYIMDIIGDLIEIGVDVLNCQMKLLGADRLAERFGGKVTFHTDMDRQGILPFGTEEEIREQVREVVSHLGKFSGGLILCAELGPDMPIGNIRALFEEFDVQRRK